MPAYQVLTAVRATEPDPVALLVALRASDATIGYSRDGLVFRLKKATDWSAGDISAAQTALNTVAALTPQRQAQNAIDAMSIETKAVILALIDQLNVIRAALPTPLSAITPAQALAAVRAKAGTL